MKITGIEHGRLRLFALVVLIAAVMPMSAFAQGSIFGTVQNSDLSTPTNGEISFFGFLDDTDEEIRIETSTGAGYDNGNWFDDFQNYLTEAPGNPYDYCFYNIANSEGFHLAKLIPNNSFQQEDIQLAPVSWPLQPTGLTATTVSSSTVVINWNDIPGLTYHVYRRFATSNGSFFRLDNPAGPISDPGVSDSFYVDTGVDGVSSYDYLIIAEDPSGDYSRHSTVATVSSAAPTAPVVTSIDPISGLAIGGTTVDIYGSGFDPAGASATVGVASLTGVTVVSPYHLTGTTQAGPAGPADIVVTNTASGLASGPLVGGYTYTANHDPVLAAIGDKGVLEGENLNFNTSATDADGDTPVLTSSALPGTAIYTDNLNGTGTFDWTPTLDDSGSYLVTFYATDGAFPAVADSETITITVTNVNQEPVLAVIGDRGVLEGANLNFATSASDTDGDTPAMTSSALPGTAIYTDNLNGTGTFDWTPTFDDSGSYLVTFYATDGAFPAVVDSETITITVTNVNREPILAAIGDRGVGEGVNLNFATSASDADGDTPVLTSSALPGTAIYTDNLNGTGTFDWTPTVDDSGSYLVTFYATDGAFPAVADSETITITVSNANQDPVLAAIGDKGVLEGANLNFVTSASDADGDIPAMTSSALPGTATYTDNLDGTGTFDWTPTLDDSGSYLVTFYATDGAFPAVADSETITITVSNTNQEPVLAAIGDKGVLEGANLNFVTSATDADGDIPAMTSSALPGTATYTDNLNGTGTFDWTPTLDDSGSYLVTFYATDGAFPAVADSETITITVSNLNRDPVLAVIGDRGVGEGVNLNFATSASDADGDTPVLTSSALPGTAIYTDNLNGTGTFDWTPTLDDSGSYLVTFYATDGAFPAVSDSETITITVSNTNQEPVLAAIGDRGVGEGVNLNFATSASDADGDTPVMTSSALPGTAIYTDNLNGTGTFDWTPTVDDSGSYLVTFYATDGAFPAVSDSETITITVSNTNQEPVLAAIGDRGVGEGVNLNFATSASDADGDTPVMTSSALPGTAIYTDNLNGTGTFDWTPTFDDSGSYLVTFYATDGAFPAVSDSETITITVSNTNQEPVLAAIGDKGVLEGENLNFNTSATDADSDIPAMTSSALPGTATYTDNLDGTGTFDWTPTFADSGSYPVTFYATDGAFPAVVDSETITIAVSGVNQVPVLAVIGDQGVLEGENLNFNTSASDGDGVIPIMTSSALPGTATYTDNLDGTGTFDWTPTLADSGSYLVTFYATDGAFPAVVDSETITITVSNANQEPVIVAIGDKGVLEGENLNFNTSATDADGDIPAMTSSALPGTATYTDNLDGTGTFDWTPTLDDSGSYLVTFYAADGAFPAVSDSETITITVSNTNQEPVLAFIGTQTTPEGGTLDFTASATDPDGDTPFMSTSELPGAAAFVDNGNGTGTFTWVTTFLDAGTYLVTFYATDEFFPGSIDSEQVTIVVGEIGNQAPVWVPLNDTAVYEGTSLILNVSASDPDGDSVALSVNTTLGEYGFADNGDGSGVLTYQPTYADAGIDTVRFIATDDGSPQLSAIFEITVATYDINQPPEFEPAGPFTTAVNDTLVFTVTASDPTDSTGGRLYLSVLDGPANSQLVDNGDNTGTFTFAPAVGQAGIDTVIFLAVDDETPGLTGSLPVEITVLAINFPPVLNSIGPQAVLEGEVLVINASAIDPDGALPPIMSVDTVLENAVFVDNLDGTAVYTFSPNYVQAGLYAVTFEASDGSDSDQEIVLIQVNEAGNQTPMFDSVPSLSVVEADTLIDMVTGSDPDLDSISFTLDTATVPENFTLTDNGDGTASFTFTPSYVQAGIYDIGVIVSDGELADTAILTIDVVEVGNQKPVLGIVFDAFIKENENLTFEVFATDIDGPPPVLTAAPLPGTATFEDPEADGIGTFDWTPSYDDSGVYVITYYATDADFPSDIDSVQATITVEDVNRKPWYMIPFNQADTVFEGDILEYSIIAWDDDGSIPFIEAYVNGTDSLATNMTLEQSIDGLNRNGLLTFTPDHSQGDIVPPFYYVKFYVIDEFDASLMDSSETITFEVIDKNQYPYLETSDGPGPFDMDEGDTLAFWVQSHDDDGISTLSVENLPDSNYTLDHPAADSMIVFQFRPDYIQAGQYFVSFIAIDDNLAADTLVIEINVAEAGNQAPVWSTPLPDTIDVFVSIYFDTTVSAIDPEGGGVILQATPVIPNASWDTANGEGIYAFTPAVDQAGSVYQVLFIATDELGVADTMITHFNVTSALRGDTDSDDVYTMNDVVFLAAYIFRSGPAPHPLESGDADMSGAVNVADIAYMINFLYNFGPRPPQ